ncbi:MAG: NAD-dependent epimerase/dehydratase family protein [Nitrospina sp.]|jgi:dTDP-glucose 4,6-dehydratase|nr:NAD-dependent epimerase/dehydratase family protein [Nitrospina sp.]MBT3857487.1 NAD-dependent epimerase/dehydratase family protein [Nitrospina sp.]MBT4104268.1 NAD-dependent epimerase/dehydratase family protein [Nitrospina sp.]MBT4390568.1 NAD-dependent epimerase/dehydratase family protein [Nitrospina sp.]MBT4622109.1 NAD-dependent epimerase/dehydratase family protein [Nitrospina sp.]
MAEKIVVIGSNSFSGASFIRYALEQGLDVIGTSRSEEANNIFLPYKWIDKGKFEFHELDLNHDLNGIMDLVNSEKPDYVINFAAQSMVAQSWDNPEHWFMTNVVSTVKLHDRLRRCSFLKKYVHISTPEVYGSCDGFIKESTSYNPSTPYAVSRAAADMSLHSFLSAYQFPVVFTRAANVYGPGQQLYRIIPRTVLYIKMGKQLQLHGGGLSKRSFIHMKDVSDATLRIARNAPIGEIYHVSTNDTISICDLVKMICEIMNASFEDLVEVGEERLGKDSAYLLDSSKARDSLGWEDKITLREGLSEVIDWVEKNFENLQELPNEYIHKP